MSRHKDLMEKAMQCIHLARTIKDRYDDPAKVPAEDAKKMQDLISEAMRLKGLAATEKQSEDLESWAAQPDGTHDALGAEAAAAVKDAGANGGDAARFPEVAKQVATKRFAKALRGGTDALDAVEKADLVEEAGGGQIIVPEDIAGPIFKTLPELAVFRSIGPTVRPTTSNRVDVRELTTPSAGWGKLELGVPATDADIGADGPDVIEVHDLVALAKVGNDLLEDTDVNLVSTVQEIVGEKFAEQEDFAFSNGNGTSKPWGLQARATSITQAVTAASPNVYADEDLKRLQYRITARWRQGGAYAASASATEAVALLKDNDGRYIWEPSAQADQPDVLFGKRWYTLEGLTSGTATQAEAFFGNFRAGYMIADRRRITVQRLTERYADEGKTGFLFTLRVGGDVIRPAAFAKLMV